MKNVEYKLHVNFYVIPFIHPKLIKTNAIVNNLFNLLLFFHDFTLGKISTSIFRVYILGHTEVFGWIIGLTGLSKILWLDVSSWCESLKDNIHLPSAFIFKGNFI